MNKKATPPHLGKNATNIIASLLIIFSITSSFSQNIDGEYCLDYKIKEHSNCYYFRSDGTFVMTKRGNMGTTSKGSGHFSIDNSILNLKYDLTKPDERSYYRWQNYYNTKDSVNVKVEVRNFTNEIIRDAQVWIRSGDKIYESTSDSNGKSTLVMPKKDSSIQGKLVIENSFFKRLIINLELDANYTIRAYLSPTNSIGFDGPKFIKNEIESFEIIEAEAETLKLKKDGMYYTIKKKQITFFFIQSSETEFLSLLSQLHPRHAISFHPRAVQSGIRYNLV